MNIILMLVLSVLNIANFWFTFGLWPQNWFAWFSLSFLPMLLTGVLAEVGKAQSK